jgi:hypothetical protein
MIGVYEWVWQFSRLFMARTSYISLRWSWCPIYTRKLWLSLIFIKPAQWNNSPHVDMSPHFAWPELRPTIYLNRGKHATYYRAVANWLIWFDFWYLTSLSNISAISRRPDFSGGRSRSTRREPLIMGKQLVNFITCSCESSAPFL